MSYSPVQLRPGTSGEHSRTGSGLQPRQPAAAALSPRPPASCQPLSPATAATSRSAAAHSPSKRSRGIAMLRFSSIAPAPPSSPSAPGAAGDSHRPRKQQQLRQPLLGARHGTPPWRLPGTLKLLAAAPAGASRRTVPPGGDEAARSGPVRSPPPGSLPLPARSRSAASPHGSTRRSVGRSVPPQPPPSPPGNGALGRSLRAVLPL